MKHSDINHSENSFGIHLSNKSFSIPDSQMSINNSNNTLMIGSVIQAPIHPNSSSILSTALNTTRLNPSVLTKSSSSSTSTINANMVGQLAYISPNNNTIKLVNLSKCQQLQNLNKDNSNIITNNSINVQFVTPILNNTSNSANDCTVVSNSVSKVDNPTITKAPVVLTSISNQSMTSNNSITCTRFILHSSQAPILPHATVTIIPHHSEIGGGNLMNNQLIKSARYTVTGSKQTPQAIRPITACPTQSVNQISGFVKQSISKISPGKQPVTNYTITIPDSKSTVAIQELVTNRHSTSLKDHQRPVTKPMPITPINYTSNNIRLALTSNIPNSKVNINPSKVQLISPKVRKRSGSPVTVKSDGKSKDLTIGSKDENIENPSLYNSQLGNYSPARKRARKQHLKVDSSKLLKPSSNSKFEPPSDVVVNNSPRYCTNDRPVSVPVSIAPTLPKIVTCLTTNCNTAITNTTNCSPQQIIVPLKTPIHISTSKSSSLSSTLASLYNGSNVTVSSNCTTVTSSSTISGNHFGQIQIIAQNSHCRPIQLSPIAGSNIILSPIGTKTLTSGFSAQKVIHIAPSLKSGISTVVTTDMKNEKTSLDLLNAAFKEEQNMLDKETLKSELLTEVKNEVLEESSLKYGLFPYKYHWNGKRCHFEKECDVKIKRARTSSNIKQSSSENHKEKLMTIDSDVADTSWRLYKATRQLLMQQRFDEDNLRHFRKLRELFRIKPPRRDDNNYGDCDEEPIFQKICLSQQNWDPLPDQIDEKSFPDFTDPKLFGISDDIITNHINIIISDPIKSQDRSTSDNGDHRCSDSCLFYLSQVPAVSQPPQHLRILDLLEGLIVKETKIIEKESEIHDQCLRLIENSEYGPLSIKRHHRHNHQEQQMATTNTTTTTVKMVNGHRL